jgi:DNA-binding MarR family transcriptional regulator/ribosomal protein S18 acetylase RimI-like enzyme
VDDDLLPAERKVLEALGEMPLDFRAMAAVSNLFRASAAVRRHMERRVLADDRLSWTSFVVLWVLWVWGDLEARDLASAVGISRPTSTGVVTTLERRGYVRRRRNTLDGRMVSVSLTPEGRKKIETLFPTFNEEEVAVTEGLTAAHQEQLASMLRTVLRTVTPDRPVEAWRAPAADVRIRQAGPVDAERVADVFIASFGTLTFLPKLHTDDETRAFVANLVMPRQDVVVAEDASGIVGFIAMADGDTVEHLYVDPAHQRAGVGTALLVEAKRRMPAGFRLWVFQANEAARRFYEKHGLHVIRLTDGSGNEEKTPDALYEWRGHEGS